MARQRSLSWISEEDLDGAISTLISNSNAARVEAGKRMLSNVVDPFSSLLLASTLEIDSGNALRNIQESFGGISGMFNAIGLFHQALLGSVEGWKNHDAGYDLESTSRCLVAEVKNKHNTMNGGKKRSTIHDLETAVQQKGRGWEAWLVIIVPKKPKRCRKKVGNRVFELDGATAYAEITGEESAIHDLLDIMYEKLGKTDVPISDSIRTYCDVVLKNSIPM